MSALCKTCGKPPLANRAGSVTSYFFQHNYCQCESVKESVSQGFLSGVAPAKSDDQVCANCGKSRPSNRRAGSFTAFLFKELRCNCAGVASKAAAQRGADASGKGYSAGSGASARSSSSASSPGPTRLRSRTAARVAQRKQFTESLRKSKVGREFIAEAVFRPGSVIGGAFRIESMIGQGGMGVVYLAEQMSLKKQVALKILAPELVDEQSWLRFKAEAKTLSALNHSSLVKVYDLGIHENTIPYYSMDFLPGKSLEEILTSDGSLPLKKALTVFIEALEGLAYAHRNGIVHRDLKPGNIMLCTIDGINSVRILDFGISKLVGPNSASSQSLTAAGEIFGSPFYMSPEQCSGSAVDARSDIYSMGCTLIEVLTGFVPFEGEEFIETVMMHQDEPPPLLSDLEPRLKYPTALDRVLAKCLAKRPQDRYQSAKEMALDLGRVLEGREVVAAELVPLPQAASASSYSAKIGEKSFQLPLLPTLCAAGAAVVLVAGSAYFIFRPTPAVDYSPQLRSAASTDAVDDSAAAKSSEVVDLSAFSTPSSGSNLKVARKVAAASRDGATEANNTMFESIPDIDGSSLKPKGSENETFKYSTIVVENGRRLRRFSFPTDTFIGLIRVGKNSNSQSATGVIDVPADAAITFTSAGIVSRYPQYLQRFRSDDINSLILPLQACSDKVLSAAANMTGLSELRLIDGGELTDKGFKVVGNFKQLSSFFLDSSNLTGEGIARLDGWQNLKRLTWRDANQPGAFFNKLQSSKGLVYLDLSTNRLSHSDFLLISKLTGLEHLSLANTRTTVEDLEAISILPKLTGLDLTNSGLGVKAIPVLQKMKSLRRLAILRASSPPEFKTKLINQLPHVKVYGWSESMRMP